MSDQEMWKDMVAIEESKWVHLVKYSKMYEFAKNELAQKDAEIKRYREALEFCAKPSGAYKRDPNEHARECLIESMKAAKEALHPTGQEEKKG